MISTSFDEERRCFAPSMASVRERLGAARGKTDLAGFLTQLHWTDLRFVLEAPQAFEDVPDLPDRVRGALGRTLERRRACLPEGACDAWGLLFGKHWRGESGGEFHPFVVRTDRAGNRMTCVIRLVGFADCWSAEIAASAFEAFEAGIAVRRSGHNRVPLRVIEATQERRWFSAATRPRPTIVLRFETPLIVRNRDAYEGSLEGLATSMRARLRSIGRWCDATLTGADALIPDRRLWDVARTEIRAVRWRRRSTTHPDGTMMLGVVGDVELTHVSDEGFRLCSALEPFHIGGGASAGLGRFVAIAW
jgi:hypothetical protein